MEVKDILVTGGTGFVGRNLVPALEDAYRVWYFGSEDYDLLDFQQADRMFRDLTPKVVVHLASKSGGILANKNYPAEFWFKNMMMTAHIWELSARHKVEKLIYVMPGCAYPKTAATPIREEDIWNGFPDEFPAPGATAKKMGILASYAYKKQHGLNSCVVIPANMFGPEDLFDEQNSHVIPALLSKFHKAKEAGAGEVVLWGTGRAVRDFIYVKDVVNCIPYFIENDINFPSNEECLRNVVNVSTGVGCSIKELVEVVADVVGYDGKLAWDDTKPEGPLNKTFCNDRMKSLGLKCETTLREGIEKTYAWFIKQ